MKSFLPLRNFGMDFRFSENKRNIKCIAFEMTYNFKSVNYSRLKYQFCQYSYLTANFDQIQIFIVTLGLVVCDNAFLNVTMKFCWISHKTPTNIKSFHRKKRIPHY